MQSVYPAMLTHVVNKLYNVDLQQQQKNKLDSLLLFLLLFLFPSSHLLNITTFSPF